MSHQPELSHQNADKAKHFQQQQKEEEKERRLLIIMSTIHLKIALFLLSFSLLIIFILVFPLYQNFFQQDTQQCANITIDGNFTCANGTFPCRNCYKCVPRSGRCNKKLDCPDGSDEEDCAVRLDTSGMYGRYMDEAEKQIENSEQNFVNLKPANCSENDHSAFRCACRPQDTDVIACNNQGKTSLPDKFASTVRRVLFSYNDIKSIENITWPESMYILGLDSNLIVDLDFRNLLSAKSLRKLYLSQNLIESISYAPSHRMRALTELWLNNNELRSFDTSLLETMPHLKVLFLKNNSIDLPNDANFELGKDLEEIHLSHNNITKISAGWFSNMTKLHSLYLDYNQISFVEEGAFDYDKNLIDIDLSHNQIIQISRYTFVSFNHELTRAPRKIEKLCLNDNPISNWNPNTLADFKNLTSLNLDGIEFSNIENLILPLTIEFIYFKKYSYCQSVILNEYAICEPDTDGISTRRKLLAYPSLVNVLSFMAIICTFGNVFVFAWRTISRERNDILDACIKNLSVADLLMGFYLCAIYWKGSLAESHMYGSFDTFVWKREYMCTFIGVLAIISSELSVFILLIITIERYRSVVSTEVIDTYENKRRAKYYVCLAWLFSLLIALFPLASKLFNSNQIDIYSTSNLCIPLHIEDPFSSGWMYSAFIYLGINGFALLAMVVLYIRMYLNIMSSHHKVNRNTTRRHEDAILALRFILIVIASCLCWLPIAVVKIKAMSNNNVNPWTTGWLVVFIIPINSALNPIIYTLAAPSSLRTALFRGFRPLRRYINMTSRRYIDSLSANVNRYGVRVKNKSNMKRDSDEFSSLSYGKKRRKNGSNSTTCDTFDTSVSSSSQRRSTEVSRTGTNLLEPREQPSQRSKNRSKYYVGEDEFCFERLHDPSQLGSQGAATTTTTATNTSDELESQPPPAYDCLVIYQDQRYENLMSTGDQSSIQHEPNNDNIQHLIIDRYGSSVSQACPQHRRRLDEVQCDSLNSFSSSSCPLSGAKICGGLVRDNNYLVDYQCDKSNSTSSDQNNNSDSARITNNPSCEGNNRFEQADNNVGADTSLEQLTTDNLIAATSGQTNSEQSMLIASVSQPDGTSNMAVSNNTDLSDACRASFDSQSSQTNLIN